MFLVNAGHRASRVFAMWALVLFLSTYGGSCLPVLNETRLKSQTEKFSDEQMQKELGNLYSAFKQHELQKQVEMLKKFISTEPENRKALIAQWTEELLRRQEQQHTFSPGSLRELQHVWQEDDKMDPENYDSRTFFKTHDLDGDEYLSPSEIKAMLYGSLLSLYNKSDDKDWEKMDIQADYSVKTLLRDIDIDGDGRISINEFLRHNWNKAPESHPTLTDMEDVPDFEHSQYNEELKAETLKQLRAHPDDAVLEEAMHFVSGAKINSDSKVHDSHPPPYGSLYIDAAKHESPTPPTPPGSISA